MEQLFGGSSSESKATSHSKAKSKSKSDTVDVTVDQYKGLRDAVAGGLLGLFGGSGSTTSNPFAGPNAVNPNDFVAPIGANEQTLLNRLMNDPLTQQRQTLLGQTLSGNFLPGQPGSNPFLQSAIEAAQRPTQQALVQALERSLPGRFTQGGQFIQPQGSSAFDRAAAVATGETARALSDIATNMSFQGYEAERGRQQEAISLSQGEVDTTIKNLQAQALPRLIQDMGVERGLEFFNKRMESLISALGIAGELSQQFGTKARSKSKAVSRSKATSESSSSNGIFGSLFGGL